MFYKGFLKEEVKAKGRGDTKHHEALHSRSLLNIQKLLAVLTKVMKCEKPSHEYTKLKEEIPSEYKETWHRLLPFGNMFVISLLTGRRGREGLSEMKKNMFQKTFDEDSGVWAYQQVVGEKTKNHRFTDEDLRKGGIIPFMEMESGFNAGEFMDEYLKLLNPDCPYMHQRPRPISSKCKLETAKCLFERQKMGVNTVAKYMETVSFPFVMKLEQLKY